MSFISEAFGVVFDFIDMGGPVLLLIGGLLFLMWSLIFERIFYFSFTTSFCSWAKFMDNFNTFFFIFRMEIAFTLTADSDK